MDYENRKNMECLFTENKESDEKIRQFLIHEVTETTNEIMSYRNMNKKDVLDWLEKQGQTFTKKDVEIAYLKGVNDTKREFEKQEDEDILSPAIDWGDDVEEIEEMTDTIVEWDEEDDAMLNQIIEDVEKLAGPYVCYYKDVNWLKSLRDRIQGKTTSEAIKE